MAAIGVHHTETDEAAWDGPANEARLKLDQSEAFYRRAYAWRDPEGDATKKASYKFIHHFVDGEGNPGAASTRGCSAGIAVLNGGRGGTTIPDADRQGVYNHLAAHLKDAQKTPPDLAAFGGEIERRSMSVPPLEVREEGGQSRIVGYAALFNVMSDDLGFFHEIIKPGAFTTTLQNADVRALWQHDPNFVLGRTKSGSLALVQDEIGLRYTITPPDTSWARDTLVTMRRGDVNQSSFAFSAIKDEWAGMPDGSGLLRSLVEVNLYDVSPVTYPAYAETSATVRSMVSGLQRSGIAQVGGAGGEQAVARARVWVLRARLDLEQI